MERVTRRKAMAMGGVPVLVAAGAYAAGGRGLWRGDPVPRFDRADAGSARAQIQQRHLPNLPLVTHDRELVRFYDDLVKDKKVVLSFISSRAPAESAKVTHNLGALQRFFGNRVGWDVFLYSISRTPELDTPAVLKRWAARSDAGPGWRFLTGEPSHVETLRRRLGFASADPAEDADPAYSIGRIRFGVEPEMRWAGCESQAPARALAHVMLLDFGAGPTDPASLPIWNCELLLRGVR